MKDCMHDPSRISQTRSPTSFLAKNSNNPLRQVRGGSRHVGDRFGNVSGKHGLWSCHPDGTQGTKTPNLVTVKRCAPSFVLQPWSGTELPGWDNFVAPDVCVCVCVFVDYNTIKLFSNTICDAVHVMILSVCLKRVCVSVDVYRSSGHLFKFTLSLKLCT